MDQEEQKQDIGLSSDEQAEQQGSDSQEYQNEGVKSDGEEKPVQKSMAIIAVLAVVVVVLALVYMWGISAENAKAPSDMPSADLPALPNDDVKTDSLKQVSTSDDISDIEKDINSTDLDNLDTELDQVESDLNKM